MTTEEPTSQVVTSGVAEVQARRAEALLLDVRTPAEFAEAHIPGSVLHPLSDLDPAAVKRLAAAKSGCVIVCRSGNRARQAAAKLAAAGVPDLIVLDGGVLAWESAGGDLNRGRKTMSLERQVRIAAGAIVLTGVVLGFAVNPGFFLLSGFVGGGLIFAGLTDWCGMGMLIARMPWNTRPSSGVDTSCCVRK
jgi:rhodanese-related sulfurtransferase